MARNRQTATNYNESDSLEDEEEEFPSASQESNSSDAPNLESVSSFAKGMLDIIDVVDG